MSLDLDHLSDIKLKIENRLKCFRDCKDMDKPMFSKFDCLNFDEEYVAGRNENIVDDKKNLEEIMTEGKNYIIYLGDKRIDLHEKYKKAENIVNDEINAINSILNFVTNWKTSISNEKQLKSYPEAFYECFNRLTNDNLKTLLVNKLSKTLKLDLPGYSDIYSNVLKERNISMEKETVVSTVEERKASLKEVPINLSIFSDSYRKCSIEDDSEMSQLPEFVDKYGEAKVEPITIDHSEKPKRFSVLNFTKTTIETSSSKGSASNEFTLYGNENSNTIDGAAVDNEENDENEDDLKDDLNKSIYNCLDESDYPENMPMEMRDPATCPSIEPCNRVAEKDELSTMCGLEYEFSGMDSMFSLNKSINCSINFDGDTPSARINESSLYRIEDPNASRPLLDASECPSYFENGN